MQLTFNKYRERKDADGKSFLDIECILYTSEPKVTRISVSIPSSDNIDPAESRHPYKHLTLHFDEPIDGE